MITLNSEKELVRIDNWSDIVERPDYVADVDPSAVRLEAIIGSYSLSDDVRCGLSTCHTPHKRGYLVSTTSSVITNIGNVCGKRHFSVDFETLRRTFDRDVRVKTQKEAVRAFQSRIPDIENQIEDLRSGDFGATWAQRHIYQLKTPGQEFPESARRLITDLARTGQTTIFAQRVATEQEVQDIEAIEGRRIERPHYLSEPVGSLVGLNALLEDNDLRELLVKDLEAGMDRLTGLNLEEVTPHQLQLEARWVGEADAKLEKAEVALHQARQLLTKSNLSQLAAALTDEKDKKRLRSAIANLPEDSTT